jgi:hypothetical protein
MISPQFLVTVFTIKVARVIKNNIRKLWRNEVRNQRCVSVEKCNIFFRSIVGRVYYCRLFSFY